MKGGVYVYRTRKPHAVVGLPLVGRHTGYVGETNNFRRRDREHLEGSDAYTRRVEAKDWADLEPKVYRLPLPDLKWLRLLVEQLLIWVLCPAYNVRGQGPWNMRRVGLKRQRAQRWRRDQFGATGKLAITLARWVILAAAAWAAWKIWGWTR